MIIHATPKELEMVRQSIKREIGVWCWKIVYNHDYGKAELKNLAAGYARTLGIIPHTNPKSFRNKR
jgi:hypothetical protein